MEYIETDCTISHDGSTYSADGAMVTDEYLAAYPAENGVLNDWHAHAH